MRADDGIVVAAREAHSTVRPRDDGSRPIDLPVLEFALRAVMRCAGEATSLTLSVADTFTTLDRDRLAGKRATDLILSVPGRQVALAASSRFCVADDEESANELLVPALATAHASLQCEQDGERSVHFASAPLQARIRCARSQEEVQESSDAPGDR
ncbi:MAG: hypothetical protein MJA32_12980 [Proteobacteria bacterium]|nr:hypothetical protein [Pseudomonadota bacterium]